MAKYALVSMMGNVGSTTNSQGGGYGLIATRMVKDYFPEDQVDVNVSPETWQDYDALFVCEGVNFVPGSFNVPGGPQPLHHEKMKAIGNYKGIVKFINNEFDFEGFNKRLKIEDLNFPTGNFVDLFKSYGNKTRKCVIGDSHALSVWRPKFALDFTPGRTLYGFLNRNTPEQINENYDEVVLYFGNIDIRFHLMRFENPAASTGELFRRYIEFAKQLKNVTLVNLLPVEHELRKIPGTGLYKKQPFFGTREERQRLRDTANRIMNNSGLKTIQWPEEWVDEDGTKMLDILEMKQSVHLRPKHYPFLNEIVS
tara:strand:+ start:58 stop:990 length:933 start_codon:yes stop_codon:yes gene_type:complete